jgi:endonuclease-3
MVRMKKDQVEAFFKSLQEQNPFPKTELKYSNNYTLLVAVVLSAQATDVSVNKATEKLFKVADNPSDMLTLGEKKVTNCIKTIGLYRNKSKNVIALSRKLIDLHAGQVPYNRSALEALPGVGRKTANVVLNTAFGDPTIAVDTHIFRLSNRTGLAPGKNVDDVEKNLLRRVPMAYRHNAHHWLILHGRYVCKARTPLCDKCIVNLQCNYKEKKI